MNLIPWRRTRSRQEPELTPGLTEYIKETVKAEITKVPNTFFGKVTIQGIGLGGYGLEVNGVIYSPSNVYSATQQTTGHMLSGASVQADDFISAATHLAAGTYVSAGTWMKVGDDDGFHFGGTTTDGSWRLIRSGNDLVIQRRESSIWVTKDTIAA